MDASVIRCCGSCSYFDEEGDKRCKNYESEKFEQPVSFVDGASCVHFKFTRELEEGLDTILKALGLTQDEGKVRKGR